MDADHQHRSIIPEQEKELEILVLHYQLAILQRKCDKPVKPNRIEKMTLAVLTARLKQITHKTTSQLRDIIRIFQPETVICWHRELVRRKWTATGSSQQAFAAALLVGVTL